MVIHLVKKWRKPADVASTGPVRDYTEKEDFEPGMEHSFQDEPGVLYINGADDIPQAELRYVNEKQLTKDWNSIDIGARSLKMLETLRKRREGELLPGTASYKFLTDAEKRNRRVLQKRERIKFKDTYNEYDWKTLERLLKKFNNDYLRALHQLKIESHRHSVNLKKQLKEGRFTPEHALAMYKKKMEHVRVNAKAVKRTYERLNKKIGAMVREDIAATESIASMPVFGYVTLEMAGGAKSLHSYYHPKVGMYQKSGTTGSLGWVALWLTLLMTTSEYHWGSSPPVLRRFPRGASMLFS